MTWTYSGNPASSNKDKVRFLVGDTDINDQLVSDEEINWILSQYSDVYISASVTALAIAAKFSRLADKAVGELKISLSQKAEQYNNLADVLMKMAKSEKYPAIYAGGIEIGEREADEQDPTLNKSIFRRGLFEE